MSGWAIHCKTPIGVVGRVLGETDERVRVLDDGDCGCCWGEKADKFCTPHTVVIVPEDAGWDMADALHDLLLESGVMVLMSDGDDWSENVWTWAWLDWCPTHVRQPVLAWNVKGESA